MFHSEVPLHTLFERAAEAHPERIAVSFGQEHLTYGELNGKSNELAHWLRGKGIQTERRVGVCLRPCLGIIICLLAIQKAGGTYVPIDPDYPIDRIKSITEDASLALTLSQDELIEQVGGVLVDPHPYQVRDPSSDVSRFENPVVQADDQATACIFYTSGTTGQPKGIALSYSNLSYYVLSAIDRFGMTPADTTLSIARYSFSISLFDLMTSVVSGGRLILLPRDLVMNYGDLAAVLTRATVAHIGPSLLKGLVRHIQGKYTTFEAFSGLRHVSSGGDFVPADLLEGLKAVFNQAEIYVIYGCTEIACMGCFYPVPRDAPVLRSYLGKPFTGTGCVLLGDGGGEAPEGEIGEICFRGPGVMKGYLNQPELTKNAFVKIGAATYYRTGDIGRLHASGDLEFLGRRDFQIKLRGQRIEVVEIESHLRRAPGVRDAVVSATGVGTDHSRLVAYLTVEEPGRFSLEPVRAYLKAKLPDYMQPSGWIVLDSMPLNVNLKISRKDLPLPTPGNMVDTENHVEPRTDLERTLASIWQEILGVPRVGIRDNFFHIGGDSLMVMNLCMLAAEHGFRISPSQLADSPTIAQLAEAGLGQEALLEGSPVEEPLDEWLASIPPVILRFLYERGSTAPHHWNISRVLTAQRPLSPDLMERTLRHLGARHDALRLQFERQGERWEARVLETALDTLVFRAVDLSGLPSDKQTATITDIAKACQGAVNLTTGPLACMTLFELGEGRPQEIFFVVHHFAMDVISWKNFWLEFDSVYRKLEAGSDVPHSSPAVSFKRWAHLLARYTNTQAVESDVHSWLRKDWSRVSALPKDLGRERALNTNDSAQHVLLLLPEGETLALFRRAGAGISFDTILISALAVALGRWQGTDTVYFDRLVHGRNVAPAGFDVSRTLGCMISYAPTLLSVDVREPVEAILQSISAQMTRHGDAGTSIDLYRYLGSNPALTGELEALPKTEVLINYRGKVDDVIGRSHLFSRTYDITGLDHDPSGLRLYPIAISADIVNNQLETRFVFSTNMHRREHIEDLSAEFLNFLQAIPGLP